MVHKRNLFTLLLGIFIAGVASAEPVTPSVDVNSPAFKQGEAEAQRMLQTRPKFDGATERWTCAWTNTSGRVIIQYIGIFYQYAKDEFGLTMSVISNSADSLVLDDSTYGQKSYTGERINQILRAIVIDRRDYSMRVLFLDEDMNKSQSFSGQCSKD